MFEWSEVQAQEQSFSCRLERLLSLRGQAETQRWMAVDFSEPQRESLASIAQQSSQETVRPPERSVWKVEIRPPGSTPETFMTRCCLKEAKLLQGSRAHRESRRDPLELMGVPGEIDMKSSLESFESYLFVQPSCKLRFVSTACIPLMQKLRLGRDRGAPQS